MNICSLPVAKGLDKKIWFHGEIDRASAESLLRNEGDFLVRLSRSTTNNFVLSGFTNSVPKHFLLLDENDLKVCLTSFILILESYEFFLFLTSYLFYLK